ncbi:hypothetical protein ABFS83_05G089600 [Erythranthe nasuta]
MISISILLISFFPASTFDFTASVAQFHMNLMRQPNTRDLYLSSMRFLWARSFMRLRKIVPKTIRFLIYLIRFLVKFVRSLCIGGGLTPFKVGIIE